LENNPPFIQNNDPTTQCTKLRTLKSRFSSNAQSFELPITFAKSMIELWDCFLTLQHRILHFTHLLGDLAIFMTKNVVGNGKGWIKDNKVTYQKGQKLQGKVGVEKRGK
jgi:hypothetical protein